MSEHNEKLGEMVRKRVTDHINAAINTLIPPESLGAGMAVQHQAKFGDVEYDPDGNWLAMTAKMRIVVKRIDSDPPTDLGEILRRFEAEPFLGPDDMGPEDRKFFDDEEEE